MTEYILKYNKTSAQPNLNLQQMSDFRIPLPSLNDQELIVNTEDLQRLQRHVNYPLILQAINESRQGGTKPVPQHAEGSYPIDKSTGQESNSNTNPPSSNQDQSLHTSPNGDDGEIA